MKPLLFMLDEAQELFAQLGIASKILALRHYNVCLVSNFQNASRCPVEVRGNSAIVSFRLTDRLDQQVFAGAAGFATREQSEALGFLEIGCCIARLPQADWKSPFRATVPTIEFANPDASVETRSKEFLSAFSWTPLPEGKAVEAVVVDGMDDAAERFLRDVLNQAHEASSLTSRFERSGIRSASKQGQVIRRLCADGYITLHSLAVGRGRPLKLCAPTDKAFAEFNVTWKQSRGSLPVRVATSLLERKLKKFESWTCVREGMLRIHEDEKAVDLLLRDSQGRVVSVEVAGNASHEVHNALFCLRCKDIVKHVVVCLNRGIRDEVTKRFAACDELAGDNRIEILLLSQVLNAKWMPPAP